MTTSIVIATHNRAHMVGEAIDSALALPGPARELIVVNDGSTDHTSEVLESYRGRITVVNAAHGERSNARNAGLKVATGDWIAFMDDDDVYYPAGIPSLEREAERAGQDVGVIYGKPRYVKLNPDNPLLDTLAPGTGQQGWIFQHLTGGNFITTQSSIARRSVVNKLDGFDPKWPPVEDYDLWLRLSKEHRAIFVDVEVAEMRLHGSNSSNDLLGSGRKSAQLQEAHLLTDGCREYAKRRQSDGDPQAAVQLAAHCLNIARRRWWEGDNAGCRAAWQQAHALHPASAMSGLHPIWRAWVPVQRPAWLRRAA